MISTRLGAIRDPEAPFPLDRVLAIVLRVVYAIGVALTIRNTVSWWHYYEVTDPALTYLGYLQRGWWVHARYLSSTVLVLWLTFGLAKGRRWAFVCLVLLRIGDIAQSIAYTNPFDIGLNSSELVYATMRLTGSLGVKPSRRTGGPDIPVRLDRYFAVLSLFLSVASDVLYVNSTLRGWHRAQDAGTIAYLPYLAQRWWSRIGYVGEEILVWVVTLAIFRSQRWAFVVSAILSLGWLFHPLHSGDPFYIWSNAFVLAYCAGRLVWGIYARPTQKADDH